MQRQSPVIFWLLVAATISIDVVVSSWIWSEQSPSSFYMEVVSHALILSQLSVACIWSAFSTPRTMGSRMAPLFAVVLAALATKVVTPHPAGDSGVEILSSYLGYFGLHSVLLLTVLWLLQRTKFWSRRTGVVRTWQYSLLHVLILMTIVAVLATLLRNNLMFSGSKWDNIAFVGSDLVLAVASVVIWSSAWHWLLRLGGVLGFAILLAIFGYTTMLLTADEMASLGSDIVGIFAAYYLIQALILSIWLGCGPILPLSRMDAAVTQISEAIVQ